MSRMTAPVIPPARPDVGDDVIDAAVRVLRSGQLVQGPEVEQFEHEFAALVGGRHCIAVNAGTSALHLALLVLGVGPGDEVIVPSFTFAATANSVRLAGAEPVFVDIDPDSFTIDPAMVEAAIGPRTVGLMPVHLYGQPAAMAELTSIAGRHGLFIVEDAAQAHGAAADGVPVGTFGAAACFSFYATKNLHTMEGGMVVVPDADHARTLRLLRNQGMETRYANEIAGYNLRMTDVAAAIGRVQLAKLATFNEKRREHARFFSERLQGVQLPTTTAGSHHVFHQYTIRSSARDRLRDHLRSLAIETSVFYPTPVHRLPPYRDTAAGQADLPVTEHACAEVLSLPVYPSLTNDERERIVAGVNGFVP